MLCFIRVQLRRPDPAGMYTGVFAGVLRFLKQRGGLFPQSEVSSWPAW